MRYCILLSLVLMLPCCTDSSFLSNDTIYCFADPVFFTIHGTPHPHRHPHGNNAEDLSPQAVAVLPEKMWPAEIKLFDVPAVEISADEAMTLTGRQMIAGDDRLFLVRGLYGNTGEFTVQRMDNALFVRHDSLGSCPEPAIRRALVVPLPELPTTVYVICSVAN